MKRLGFLIIAVSLGLVFSSSAYAQSTASTPTVSVDQLILHAENGVFAENILALNNERTAINRDQKATPGLQKSLQVNTAEMAALQRAKTAFENSLIQTGTSKSPQQLYADGLTSAANSLSADLASNPLLQQPLATTFVNNFKQQLTAEATNQDWIRAITTGQAVSTQTQDLSNATKAAANPSNPESNPPVGKCTSLFNASIVDCIDAGFTFFIKNTFLQLAGFLVWLTANMLNFAIQVSILNFSQWAPSSLYPIWVIIRQIISLVVVFAGLYLGFMYIIGREDTFGKYVGWLVVFALFVNFSYPVTRALTDVSNIISLNVYASAVGAAPLEGSGTATAGGLIMDRLGLSGLVASATASNTSFISGINSTPSALLAVTFVLYAAYVFFMATAIIATRTAVLVFLIVASPLLLVDSVIPKLGEVAMKMRKMFFEQLVVAPVFMIMLALTLKFMEVFQDGGALSAAAGTGTAFKAAGDTSIQTFFSILMMLIMLHIMLKVTKSVAGEAGNYATNMMGKVGGFGLGMAAGGAGLLARGTVGAAASRFQNSAWMDSMQGSKVGRGLYGLSNSLAQSTFDSRNIGMVSRGMASAGMGMGTGSAQTYEKKFAAREAAVTTKYASIKDDKARAEYYESTKNGIRSKMGRALPGGESDGDKIAKQLELKELELKKKEASTLDSFTGGDDATKKEMILKARAENDKVLEAKLTGAQGYFDAEGVGAKSDALVAIGDSRAALSIIEKDPLTQFQKKNLDEIKELEDLAKLEKDGTDKKKELMQQVEVKRKENNELVKDFRKNLKESYMQKNYSSSGSPVDIDLNTPGPQQHPGGSNTSQYEAKEYSLPAGDRNRQLSQTEVEQIKTAFASSFAENMRKGAGSSNATPKTPAGVAA